MEDEFKNCGTFAFRYEDFAQDGRPHMRAIPPSLTSVWQAEMWKHPDAPKLRDAGIVPILSRIEIDLTEDSFSPFSRANVRGRGALLSAKAAGEEHARVLVDVRSRVMAKTGHAMLPQEGDAEGAEKEEKEVGRMLGEHVLTRLFAKKEERRVSVEDIHRIGVAMAEPRVWSPPQSILEIAETEGLTAIDSDFVRDDMPLVLGLMHTDENQHVNSLVYPQLFEEAVLRRLKKLGRDTRVLARKLRMGYRKPSFAGESPAIAVRLFERGSRIVAVCMLFGEGESDQNRARVYVRLDLSP